MCKKFTAVNGLSLKMERGKVFALLGHNGAGKTTAIKVSHTTRFVANRSCQWLKRWLLHR